MGMGYGGDPGRSRVFVDSFRKELPDLPAAVTTMGAAPAPWVYPFDYAPWREHGFALMPQAYLDRSELRAPPDTRSRRSGRLSGRAGAPDDRGRLVAGSAIQSGRDYAWRLARLEDRLLGLPGRDGK